MTRLYSTADYFKDNFWFIDPLAEKTRKMIAYFRDKFKKLPDSDLDSHVFRIIENLPYGIAIFFLGFMSVIALLRATESINGIVVTSIYTNSMSPAIKPGSLVFTLPKRPYKRNDIVAYQEKSLKNGEYSGRILMHRIIEVKVNKDNTKSFIAKGDNNANPDASNITNEDILGSVRLVIPYFGYVDFLSKTIPGFIILIVIPAVLVIFEARRYLKTS